MSLELSLFLLAYGVVISDVVWPETKQVGVIDSILRNFYIPPVIFGMNPSPLLRERPLTGI